jgi:hypothetical protein
MATENSSPIAISAVPEGLLQQVVGPETVLDFRDVVACLCKRQHYLGDTDTVTRPFRIECVKSQIMLSCIR